MSIHTFPPDSVGIVETRYFTFAQEAPFVLESGAALGPVTLAYQTYGQLNAERSNAVLICHALSGGAHAAGYRSLEDNKPGWWDSAIGPGKAFDTDRFFVICSNVIGSCYGSTGPASVYPPTGKPYGLAFPVVTVGDMVRAQERLIDHLGIERLLCTVGGSMGGMQVLEWAARHPERICAAIPLATAARSNAMQIALSEVGRQAIYADPAWQGGSYYEADRRPDAGLAVARMIAHITYLSETSMHRKFGRRLHEREQYGYQFQTEFQVESYLKHQGLSFTQRFDANSYLYITKAMDYFDLTQPTPPSPLTFDRLRADFHAARGAAADENRPGFGDWGSPSVPSPNPLIPAIFRAGSARAEGDGSPPRAGVRAGERSAGRAAPHRDLAAAFAGSRALKFLVVSFTSDWLYPTHQSREIVSALTAAGADVSYLDIESSAGHDAFLVEVETMNRLLGSFVERLAREEGIT